MISLCAASRQHITLLSFCTGFCRSISIMASNATLQNKPIVISGPSGSGKSTILKRLFAEFPDQFGFSISHTTRQPRAGEQNGREYHFTTRDDFERLIADNGFLEHAQFGGNYYGTSVATVQDVAEKGRLCILDIEMEGVKQFHAHPQFGKITRFLFLKPPSLEVLEGRLRGRGTDSEEAIQRRLAQAQRELEYANIPGAHDKIIVNDDIDRTYEEVKAWIFERGNEL